MKHRIILTLLLTFIVLSVQAQRKRYDPRMRMVGISQIGHDRGWVSDMGFMFVSNPNDTRIAKLFLNSGKKNSCKLYLDRLNNQNAGKKVLDYLFQYNGHSLSEDLLKERAYKDANIDDKERARVSFIEDSIVLEEAYLPILQNNYIYVEDERHWYVYYVDISKDIALEVFNCWENMERYNQIHVPIKKVKKGKIPKKGRDNKTQYRKVGKRVPQFSLRTKVKSRNPFKADVGYLHGIENGDRFLVMRTFEKEDKNGNRRIYSKKIATVRATTIKGTESTFHTIAGGGASAKNADVLVYRPDKKEGVSLDITFQPSNEMFGVRLSNTFMTKFLRHGWACYTLGTIGTSIYTFDKDVKNTNADSNEIDFVQSYATIGPAFGYSFLRRCEIMPYLQVGLDYVTSKDKFPSDKENFDGTYDYKDATFAFRASAGARLNVNVFYPLQITGGAEYFFTAGPSLYKEMTKCYGIDKSGLLFFCGLKYNF